MSQNLFINDDASKSNKSRLGQQTRPAAAGESFSSLTLGIIVLIALNIWSLKADELMGGGEKTGADPDPQDWRESDNPG
jgi:hypothetical protein